MTKQLLWTGKQEACKDAERTPRGRFVSLEDSQGRLIEPTAHHLLIGDNLDVMAHLEKNPALRFHFIYTDPPYNTGQKFTFKDGGPGRDGTDSESAWLSMVYPRFILAHKLLRDDGILFVSIDDRQSAELVVLLKEIFGEGGHLGTIKWRKKRKASFLDQHLSTTIEYVHVFAKDSSKASRLLGEETTETTRPVLNAGNQVCERVIRKGTRAFCKDGFYARGSYVTRTLSFELLDDMTIENGLVTFDVRVRGGFRVSQDVLDKTLFVTKNFGLRRVVADEERVRRHASDDATDWPTNEDAEQELKQVFGMKIFTYPKPMGLIENLLKMCPLKENDEPFLCLDFFAGTATLAAAVMKLNQEDSEQRVSFCIQKRENLTKTVPELGIFDIADIARLRAQKMHAAFPDSLPLRILELID